MVVAAQCMKLLIPSGESEEDLIVEDKVGLVEWEFSVREERKSHFNQQTVYTESQRFQTA